MFRALFALLALSLSALAGAQTIPRAANGKTDLQGIWPGTAMMGVPIEQPGGDEREDRDHQPRLCANHVSTLRAAV